MKTYRIGIDAQAVGTNLSGNEIYIRNVINHLPEDSTLNYSLFLNPKFNYLGDDFGSKYERIFFKTKNPFIRLPLEFPYLLMKNKLDLLHVQYTAPMMANCPIVSTIHDISYEHYPELFTKKEATFLHYGIKNTAKRAAKIITVSEFSKQDIVETYHIPEKKIVVTYNSIDESFKVIDDQERMNDIKRKYEIDGDYILAVGNLQPRKNIPRLLEAYKRLRLENKNREEKLVIVGKKAWLYSDIFKKLEGFEYIQDVILTGYVPQEELPVLYNGAKLFVYPSLFEGFGLPVLEAMACGVPVVTSNVSSLPEVSGDAAILIDPYQVDEIGNGMYQLLNQPSLYEECSEKGLERAKQFSWRKTAEKTVDVYRSILF